MRKFLVTYNTGSQILHCADKREANRIVKQSIALLDWRNVSVKEIA